MDIGTRIRKERERRGWTQEDLAVKCGYKYKSSISKIESAGDEISSKKIKRVAEVLNVPISYLMGWEDRSTSFQGKEINRDEMSEVYEMLRSRAEMAILFKSAKNATKEQILSVASMLDSFKGGD